MTSHRIASSASRVCDHDWQPIAGHDFYERCMIAGCGAERITLSSEWNNREDAPGDTGGFASAVRVSRRYMGRTVIADEPFTTCPFCVWSAFEDGPRGGACVNVRCLSCGARFNVLQIPEASYPADVEVPPLDERRRLVEVLCGPDLETEAVLPLPIRALRAVLAFYRVGPWDDAARARWAVLTGGREATTKALCDLVREALVPPRPSG